MRQPWTWSQLALIVLIVVLLGLLTAWAIVGVQR